jgi:hypothetical protein
VEGTQSSLHLDMVCGRLVRSTAGAVLNGALYSAAHLFYGEFGMAMVYIYCSGGHSMPALGHAIVRERDVSFFAERRSVCVCVF